ncbi:DUF1453 family protein [Dactylosporangium aurantiacum]|uniref:DUF1453 family protein n=1 Tax=Dactylosporangium aurantiacum TaxID=35754 RepID=A0A9Q9IHB8_9ACTN|nr:DUF1453 family protein [Dactylosporangium aurantiacum]MDG6101592.1 DUF1453 family protein [Dactylosporangium aurantiacum]UWZ52575.1 DUF1453 family protein [Dactylosporangium aurantiacum]
MNLTTTLLVAVAVLYVLVRRFTGEPLQARRLVLPPVLLVGWGGYEVSHAFTGGTLPHAVLDGAVLGAAAVLAAAGGLVRGLTVRVFVRDGHLWYRYTAMTLVVWVALLGVRFAEDAAGRALGADAAVVAAALPFVIGLSFLGEAAVVGRRALATGVPFAPHRDRRPAAR